jgi:hypothetical protein
MCGSVRPSIVIPHGQNHRQIINAAYIFFTYNDFKLNAMKQNHSNLLQISQAKKNRVSY